MRELEREKNRNGGASAPLVVIGPGRVGRSLATAAAAAGIDARLAGRGEASAAARQAEVALICVPDGAITEACEAIAGAIPPLRFVGHTSGATGLEALASATGRGASSFSLHPLQTIPDGGTVLDGAPCAVSGSNSEALELARALAERLGMTPFAVPEEGRTAYHAAACIASNFLVTLEESAVELLAAAGVENGRDLLAPLVLRTAANWSERGGAALTGPIARGDEVTVERHLASIAAHSPELVEAYRALADLTRELLPREAGA
jgi:predicted short-subunit dehydrogenase-like oxidoreductase (DUF2520 family)